MWAIRASLLILSSGVLLAQADSGLTSGLTGDPTRGQTIFEGKGNCMSCHRIKGVGARTGPDLSEIARTPQQILTKLLTPDAEINAANRPFRVTLKNGTVVNGRLLNEDTFTVQLIDDKENLRSFIKTDLRDFAFVEKSPMASYKDKLSSQEIADVVAYLGTLRPPPGAGRGARGGAGAGAPAGAAVGGPAPGAPPAGGGAGGGAARGPAAPPVEPPH
jgi:putative heme-binding domain-containing protein